MLKKYFTAGLLLWLPLVITLWILESIIRWSDAIVNLLPKEFHPEVILGFHIPGIGLVLALITIFITGILVANFIGQAVVHLWESLLNRIPFVRPIYSGVKQIASTILSDNTESFKEVVLIEFPQKSQWTLGFIVSTPSKQLANLVDEPELVTVYIPTAPNPTSGYVVMVAPDQVKTTDISVDAAFKFHLSLGVMTPTTGLNQKKSTDQPYADKS